MMSIWENLGGIRGKVAVVLIAVFAAGGGTGYFAGRWHALEGTFERVSIRRAEFRRRQIRGRDLGRGRGRGMHPRFIRRLERDLNLEAGQMQKIRAALQQQHEKMMQLRMGMRPQVERILHDARNEIRILLSSGQQRDFDRLILGFEEQRQRMHRRFFRGRHMGRGRGMAPGGMTGR